MLKRHFWTVEDFEKNLTFTWIAVTSGRICWKNDLHAGYPPFPPFPEGQKSSPCDAMDQEGFQSCPAARISQAETVLAELGPALQELVLGSGQLEICHDGETSEGGVPRRRTNLSMQRKAHVLLPSFFGKA